MRRTGDEAVRRVPVVVFVVAAGHVGVGLVLADVAVPVPLVVVDDVDVGRRYGTGVFQVVVLGRLAVAQST